jgi:hypothetical protein
MAQYVEARAAYDGQVRKVVLVYLLPAERSDRLLVSIDVMDHLVRDTGGFFRARKGPRVERKVAMQEMTDDQARETAERIARESGTLYIAIVRDGDLHGGDVQPHHDSRNAAA